MSSRRREIGLLAGALCLVLVVDLFWDLVEGSTGTLAYGFVDEPAHLATCVIALGALAVAVPATLPRRFVVAALVGSVAIDADHIPGYLGSHILTGSLPRPYSHSAAIILVLLAVAVAQRRADGRQVLLGLAFGVSTHLFRDLATGPGVSFFWPLDANVIRLPYAFYASTLGVAMVTACLITAMRSVPRSRRAGAGTAAALVVAVALLALPSQAPARGAHKHSGRSHVSIGAYLPRVAEDPSVINEFARAAGRSPAILSFYQSWGRSLLLPAQIEAATAHGAIPMITWEEWTEDEEPISLWGIADGAYDSYLREVAHEVAVYGQPIFLRFGHEMNGDWYPWGWKVDGNTPAAFKAAWRHVVALFRGEGARNVRWVWCPYATNENLSQFRRFYPGDHWVDWAGLDGFNWGSYRTWQSFDEIFEKSYKRIVSFTKRPIMLPEIGVNQAGGNKAHWLTRTLRKILPRYRSVRAMVWFDAEDSRADFRINSSPRALAAFRGAVRMPYFGAGSLRLLSVPARLPHPFPEHRDRGGGRRMQN